MPSIKVYKWVSICVPLWAGWGQLVPGSSAVCGPWQHVPARPPPLCPDHFMFLEPAPTHLMSDTLLTVRFNPVYICNKDAFSRLKCVRLYIFII